LGQVLLILKTNSVMVTHDKNNKGIPNDHLKSSEQQPWRYEKERQPEDTSIIMQREEMQLDIQNKFSSFSDQN